MVRSERLLEDLASPSVAAWKRGEDVVEVEPELEGRPIATLLDTWDNGIQKADRLFAPPEPGVQVAAARGATVLSVVNLSSVRPQGRARHRCHVALRQADQSRSR